jgi:hypothetical protein
MRPTKYERFIKRAVVQSYGVASWLRSWMGPCMGSAVGNTFRGILSCEIAETLITDDTALARTRPLKSQNRILHSHTRPKSSSSESNI